MSRIVGIFVRKPNCSLGDFAEEAAGVIGMPLSLGDDGIYENATTDRLVYVHENDLSDEGDMPFSHYQFAIDVRSKSKDLQDAVVEKMFADMKSKTTYPLLVVDEEHVVARRD